jgi:hypothetical protein
MSKYTPLQKHEILQGVIEMNDTMKWRSFLGPQAIVGFLSHTLGLTMFFEGCGTGKRT